MKPLAFGSLFAGIGGFDLGFERAGLSCSWQVEIDPFCRKVLAKHWPNVRRHDDVRTFPPEPEEDWKVDVICGGFPCQDISNAGRKEGIEGERSGLWSDFARIVRRLRPEFVVVENVASLVNRDISKVLGDLATIGYDAEWHCITAAFVNAPHIRDRVFVLGHTDIPPQEPHLQRRSPRNATGQSGRRSPVVAKERCRSHIQRWSAEPRVGRMVDGISYRVDRSRLTSLGNAVVPQIAELLGLAIREAAGR